MLKPAKIKMDRFLWVNQQRPTAKCINQHLYEVCQLIYNLKFTKQVRRVRQLNSLMDEPWSKIEISSAMEGIVNILDEIEEDTERMIDNQIS